MNLLELDIDQPFDTAVALLLEGFSRDERGLEIALLAATQIQDAVESNKRVFLRDIPFQTFVDGSPSAPLESVNPDRGEIFTQFKPLIDVLLYIGQLLEQFSPVKTGRYKKSHILLADGTPMDINTPSLVPQLAAANEFVFTNTVPYARKIELGSSSQAPDGVYQAVANMARRKYSWIAKITFTYRTILGGTGGGRSERNPAIVVKIK